MKPEYGTFSKAQAEQLLSLHEAVTSKREEGEFNISEYAELVGVTYHTAKSELHRLFEQGKVTRRSMGNRSYYKIC